MSVFDELYQLRAFVSIVDCGSISAAARKLSTTQPTMSRHLSALESKAGTRLLHRDTHRMHLTHAGHQVLTDARVIIALAEESEDRLRNEQSQLKGHIRLFATIDFGQFLVSRMVASFLESHPEITIELSYTNRPIHMIEEGQDIGIIAGKIIDDSIIAKPLGEIQRSIVASPSFLQGKSIVNPNDLECWPWVTLKGNQFDSTNKMTLYNKQQQLQTISVSSILRTEGVTSIREAIRSGLGIAILPNWLIKEDLLAQSLVAILPTWQPEAIPAHVIYPSQRKLAKRLRCFIRYSAEYMRSILTS